MNNKNAKNFYKGNQEKIFKDGYYYKFDNIGYPSLSEYIVSHLYKYSNIENYVLYDIEVLKEGDINKIASKSKNFLDPGDEIITLQKLYSENTRAIIEDDIVKIDDIHDRIKYIVDFTEKVTGINTFGKYITILLEVDRHFYNDDRHFGNISVIKNKNGKYKLAPIFDNGAMLLSATNVYSLEDSIDKNISKLFSFPFSLNLSEQAKASEDLYGINFHIKYDKKIIDILLGEVDEFYDSKIIERVRKILYKTL